MARKRLVISVVPRRPRPPRAAIAPSPVPQRVALPRTDCLSPQRIAQFFDEWHRHQHTVHAYVFGALIQVTEHAARRAIERFSINPDLVVSWIIDQVMAPERVMTIIHEDQVALGTRQCRMIGRYLIEDGRAIFRIYTVVPGSFRAPVVAKRRIDQIFWCRRGYPAKGGDHLILGLFQTGTACGAGIIAMELVRDEYAMTSCNACQGAYIAWHRRQRDRRRELLRKPYIQKALAYVQQQQDI